MSPASQSRSESSELLENSWRAPVKKLIKEIHARQPRPDLSTAIKEILESGLRIPHDINMSRSRTVSLMLASVVRQVGAYGWEEDWADANGTASESTVCRDVDLPSAFVEQRTAVGSSDTLPFSRLGGTGGDGSNSSSDDAYFETAIARSLERHARGDAQSDLSSSDVSDDDEMIAMKAQLDISKAVDYELANLKRNLAKDAAAMSPPRPGDANDCDLTEEPDWIRRVLHDMHGATNAREACLAMESLPSDPSFVDGLVDYGVHNKIVRFLKLYRTVPRVLVVGYHALTLLLEHRSSPSKSLHRSLVFDDGLFELLTATLSKFANRNLGEAAVGLAYELLTALRTDACAELMVAAGTIKEVVKVGLHATSGYRPDKNHAREVICAAVGAVNALRGQCGVTLRPDCDPFADEATRAYACRLEQAVEAGAVTLVEWFRHRMCRVRPWTDDAARWARATGCDCGDGDEVEVLDELRAVQSFSEARQAHEASRAMERADAMAAELLAEIADEETVAAKPPGKSASRKRSNKPKPEAPPRAAASGRGGGSSSAARAPPIEIGGDAVDGGDAATDDARAASDAALRTAVASGELALIVDALEAHRNSASESEVSHARAVRDRLKERRKKESQRQRKAHGVMMKEMAASEVQAREDAAPTAEASRAAPVACVEGVEGTTARDAAEGAVEDAPVVDGLFVPSLELVRSLTDGFSDALRVGTGGCAVVYRATSPAGVALAIKRATYVDASALSELEEEVTLLRRCRHPHLLPLLGYCCDPDALCLLFPLMTGGSLEQRLFLSDAHVDGLTRLGHFSAPPKPLTWRQRLRVLHQATSALLYLHGLTPAYVHRDFKPANILVRADLHAMLSDTGFAKAAASEGALAGTRFASITSRGVCHTTGYADPLITSGGGFSTKTDAYAVGVTLLVCLTGRPAVRGNDGIFDAVESDHEQIFGEIDPPALAERGVGWPAHVCRALVPLVLSTEKEPSLCNPKKFKRLPLADAVEVVGRLTSAPAEPADSAAEADGAKLVPLEVEPAASAATAMSVLVREIGRKACHDETAEQVRWLQQKASEGFRGLMARLDRCHAKLVATAPAGFKERLDFWHSNGAHTDWLHGKLDVLRRWRNAAEHEDGNRWRSEGPKNEEELMRLLQECDAAVTSMESVSAKSERV